nr:hypothetical protein [Tanacetum cinerariifolium]
MESWNKETDVDELPQKQHTQQQGNQALLQPETVAENVPTAMFDGNPFVNPFALTSIIFAKSSSQYALENQLLSVPLLICLGKHDFVETIPSVPLVIKIQLLSDYNCWKDYADRDKIKDISEKR